MNRRIIRYTAIACMMFCFGGGLLGCASLNPQPPIEALTNRLVDEAIVPAIREGLAQGVEQLSIQAGAQGINPTYVFNFEGKWVVGVEGKVSIGVEGIAGQVQITSLSTEETETSPHAADKIVPDLPEPEPEEPPVD